MRTLCPLTERMVSFCFKTVEEVISLPFSSISGSSNSAICVPPTRIQSVRIKVRIKASVTFIRAPAAWTISRCQPGREISVLP